MANVFISHRGIDKAAATRLAEAIRLAQHNVWLDEWEIQIGDSIIARINDGLEGANYVVVCYSDSGVSPPWMGREWQSALARQLQGHNVKLLPVRLTGGDPPAILADVRYADMTSDWEDGLNRLLKAIR
jgi:hypothetical protein